MYIIRCKHGTPDAHLCAIRARSADEAVARAAFDLHMADEKKSAPVGDTAAIRETLVAMKKSIDGIGASSLDCDPTILMASLTQVCARLSARIERALAKPPRNCDRFGGDIDKLREACARERGMNPEEDFPEVFAEWLLTPSTERKGGSL